MKEGDSGIYVEGLTSIIIGSPEDALKLLEMGLKNRKTARTNWNEVSSRSHAILRLELTISEEE